MEDNSYEWETPQWLFDILNEEFQFTLDVCASEANHKCSEYYSKEQNGLKQKWQGTCWMNPPCGREIKNWLQKAKEESQTGVTVVCLVPARPDTSWWWDNCLLGEIRFIKGRLKWHGKKETISPFPSAIVIFGPNHHRKELWWDVAGKSKKKGGGKD